MRNCGKLKTVVEKSKYGGAQTEKKMQPIKSVSMKVPPSLEGFGTPSDTHCWDQGVICAATVQFLSLYCSSTDTVRYYFCTSLKWCE